MDGLVCDACGDGLLVDDDTRYIVRVEGYAAYDPLELTQQDLAGDLAGKTERLLEEISTLDPETLQDQVHRNFRYDLCTRCWQLYVRDPLRGLCRKPEPRDGERQDEKEKAQGD
jgi:hypothetical protein